MQSMSVVGKLAEQYTALVGSAPLTRVFSHSLELPGSLDLSFGFGYRIATELWWIEQTSISAMFCRCGQIIALSKGKLSLQSFMQHLSFHEKSCLVLLGQCLLFCRKHAILFGSQLQSSSFVVGETVREKGGQDALDRIDARLQKRMLSTLHRFSSCKRSDVAFELGDPVADDRSDRLLYSDEQLSSPRSLAVQLVGEARVSSVH